MVEPDETYIPFIGVLHLLLRLDFLFPKKFRILAPVRVKPRSTHVLDCSQRRRIAGVCRFEPTIPWFPSVLRRGVTACFHLCHLLFLIITVC